MAKSGQKNSRSSRPSVNSSQDIEESANGNPLTSLKGFTFARQVPADWQGQPDAVQSFAQDESSLALAVGGAPTPLSALLEGAAGRASAEQFGSLVIRPPVVYPPSISALVPNQVTIGVLTTIRILGSNLPLSPIPYTITNTLGQPVLGTGVQLTLDSTSTNVGLTIFTDPNLMPGFYQLRVLTSAGTATALLQLVARGGGSQSPTITSITPTLIYVYGPQVNYVAVTGTNLPPNAQDYRFINGSNQTAGGIAIGIYFYSLTSVILKLTIDPAHTPSGDYVLAARNSAGEGRSPVPLQIINFASL